MYLGAQHLVGGLGPGMKPVSRLHSTWHQGVLERSGGGTAEPWAALSLGADAATVSQDDAIETPKHHFAYVLYGILTPTV